MNGEPGWLQSHRTEMFFIASKKVYNFCVFFFSLKARLVVLQFINMNQNEEHTVW